MGAGTQSELGRIGVARAPMMRALLGCVLAGVMGLPLVAAAAGPRWIGAARPPTDVKRVVTLAPSLTETVVALGRADTLVGVSRFDDVAEANGLPRVGAADAVSLETLMALRPDVVMAQPTAGNVRNFQTLASLSIPVLVLPTETLEETQASLAAAGRVMGRAAEGRALSKQLEDTRRRLRARTAALKKPRVLLVVGFDPLVVAGAGAYLDALLQDAGGLNVAADAKSAWSVYPLERAAAARPDVILDASSVPNGQRTLSRLPTLAKARWVVPPTDAMLRPGPSLARGLEELAVLLHGPSVLEEEPPAPPPNAKADGNARSSEGAGSGNSSPRESTKAPPRRTASPTGARAPDAP